MEARQRQGDADRGGHPDEATGAVALLRRSVRQGLVRRVATRHASQILRRLSEFAKDGATVYVEVKTMESGRDSGPPFHVEKDDLMDKDAFGSWFEHVMSLGEVYSLNSQAMKQTGHILRRLKR